MPRLLLIAEKTPRNFKIRMLYWCCLCGSIMVRREYQVQLVIAERKEYVGIDEEKMTADDLGLVLVTCSAIVNFLIAKASSSEILGTSDS